MMYLYTINSYTNAWIIKHLVPARYTEFFAFWDIAERNKKDHDRLIGLFIEFLN